MYRFTTLKYPPVRRNYFSRYQDRNPACRRKLLLHHITPTMHRHGAMWFFHFPEQRQVTIRCPHGPKWITFSEVLSETSVIHNDTTCTIAANEVRTLPELRGTSQVRTDVPAVYLPDITPCWHGTRKLNWEKSYRQKQQNYMPSSHVLQHRHDPFV